MKHINKFTKKNKSKGFTLVELLIVVGVIGVLSSITIALINPRKIRQNAQDAKRMATMESLVTALNTYKNLEGSFPASKNDPTFIPSYLKEWPDGTPTPSDVYQYNLYDNDKGFILTVVSSKGNTAYKFVALADGQSFPSVVECNNTSPSSFLCDPVN